MFPHRTRYFTAKEAICVGKQELKLVLLPNDVRRPNGREFRKLMEIMNNDKEKST